MPAVPSLSPTTTLTPAPTVGDLPRTDPETVKQIAGGLVLPSGKTFRRCVTGGAPGTDTYYMLFVSAQYLGNGLWLVEYWGYSGMLAAYYNERTSALNVGVVPQGC